MNTVSKDKRAIALRPVLINDINFANEFVYYDALTFENNSALRMFATEILAQDKGKKEIVIDFINPKSQTVYGDISVSKNMFKKFIKRFNLQINEGKITKILYKSI